MQVDTISDTGNSAGMIERRDSQQIWNEISLFQYHLSTF